MKSIYGCLFILLGLTCCAKVLAEDSKTIDRSLLEDLGTDLLEATDEADRSPLDRQLLEEFGEDAGGNQQARNEGLSKVIKHMKSAQDQLQRAESVRLKQDTKASIAQGEALIGLDLIIAEITKRKGQCNGGSCNKPAEPKSGEKKKPGGKAGKKPAQSANGSTKSNADLSTDLEVAGQLVQDLWGKLPQRQRQQILQPLSEEFLPKYADQIEAYFRALAQPKQTPVESR